MSSQLESERDSRRRSAERKFYAALAGVAVVGVAGVIVSVAVPRELEPDSGWYELLKTSLQVLGVVLVGAFVGMAVFKLQQVHLDESRRDAAGLEDKRIGARRKADWDIDTRRRLDDRTLAFLTETIDAYHAVKQIRRQLEAATLKGVSSSELPAIASSLIVELSIQQLDLEGLKRRAPLLEGHLKGASAITASDAVPAETSTTSLKGHYKAVEEYLNEIVDEIQKGKPPVNLKSFIEETADFKGNVSYRIEAVIDFLERALLTPQPTAES